MDFHSDVFPGRENSWKLSIQKWNPGEHTSDLSRMSARGPDTYTPSSLAAHHRFPGPPSLMSESFRRRSRTTGSALFIPSIHPGVVSAQLSWLGATSPGKASFTLPSLADRSSFCSAVVAKLSHLSIQRLVASLTIRGHIPPSNLGIA